MPIRPENRDRYPADWKDISFRIRFVRALGQCECEGHCGTDHDGRCPARHNAIQPRTGSKIVLTVAHLDHTPENCDDTNLLAMCQRCHLTYDIDEHRATAARTRAAETATWNTPLPGLEVNPAPEPPLPRRTARERLDDLDVALLTANLRAVHIPEVEQGLAAAYVASRAEALGWSRADHETTLLALFQPPRRKVIPE